MRAPLAPGRRVVDVRRELRRDGLVVGVQLQPQGLEVVEVVDSERDHLDVRHRRDRSVRLVRNLAGGSDVLGDLERAHAPRQLELARVGLEHAPSRAARSDSPSSVTVVSLSTTVWPLPSAPSTTTQISSIGLVAGVDDLERHVPELAALLGLAGVHGDLDARRVVVAGGVALVEDGAADAGR